MKCFVKRTGKFTKKMLTFVLCISVVTGLYSGIPIVQATSLTNTGTSSGTGTTEETNMDANGTLGKNSDVGVTVTESITGKAGKKVKIQFNLTSSNTNSIKLKSVYPVIDTTFPFETSGDAYKVISSDGDAAKQATLASEFTMTARTDIAAGYHSVRFIGEYTKAASDGTVADYYVIKTINIYFSGTTVTNDTSGTTGGGTTIDDSDDDSSFDDSSYDSSDGSSYSDGGADTEATAPKLIITGYETTPEKVMAGETFTIKIHVQNTSKITPVCNGKFLIGNEAGSFIPTSGSSAVYVESIKAGETGDLTIEMKSSAELAQKNYILVIKGDFDDGKGNTFTSSDNLSIPVYQEVKLAVTDVTSSPEAIGIDAEGSLMFTINNQGNAGVYNVNVTAKDDAITAEECYVGNIAGASSAYATLNVVGVLDNSDTGVVTVVISYEDEEGTVSEMEQQIACVVSESALMDDYSDMEELYEEEESTFPWWIIVIIVVVVIAVAVTVIIIVLKKKKKKAALLEEELDDDDMESLLDDDIVDGEDEIKNEDF